MREESKAILIVETYVQLSEIQEEYWVERIKAGVKDGLVILPSWMRLSAVATTSTEWVTPSVKIIKTGEDEVWEKKES